jgi:hypothetical protein
MTAPELRFRFADHAALAEELDCNLQHGRAFLPGAHGVGALDDCTLVLVRPDDGAELKLGAQAVFVASGEPPGVGLQLRPFDPQVASRVHDFAHGTQAATATEASGGGAPGDGLADCDALERADAQAEAAADAADAAEDAEACAADQQQQPARHERLRKLNPTQQQKLARGGDFNDRVLLERLYGRAVWEALLHNPKLTLPEVARIARKGTVPRPLLEHIVENASWTQAPIIRRALLSNPRVTGEAIMRLLRLTPKHELKMIYKSTTYSTQVRDAARKLLEL